MPGRARSSYLRGPTYSPTLHERENVQTILATLRADLQRRRDERRPKSPAPLPLRHERRDIVRRP